MELAKVTTKGQITIPKAIRNGNNISHILPTTPSHKPLIKYIKHTIVIIRAKLTNL